MERDDGQVAEAERDASVLEHRGDRERHEQESGHAAEEQQPVPEDVERDGVRQPDVAVVDPPDDREQQDDLRETRPGRIVRQQPSELREREDEDEVEEELERGDPNSPLVGRRLHAPTLSRGRRVPSRP